MMDDATGAATKNHRVRIGAQPVALASAALALLLIGGGSIALWRGYTGNAPETDRAVAARQIQIRATEASEQLVEKTKALATSQQDSIDQLQALQEEMQGIKRLLAAQQNDNKRLSDQVGGLSSAIDGLRQSFASAQPAPEAAASPSPRHTAKRTRVHAIRATPARRSRSGT
jgi:uncharacterized protein HemX